MLDRIAPALKTSAALWALSLVWAAGLLISGWNPYDRGTWWMETAPAMIALPIVWLTTPRFPLTKLALVLIATHGLVLMLGGAYTYARVPIGFDIQQWLGLARNPYDRIGHFMQGLVPAIIFREMLLRGAGLPRAWWSTALVIACCLAVSAAYELIEFGAAMALGQGADEFLGTQGDPWDTQWDMLLCLIGAVSALIVCPRIHDRQIASAPSWPAPKT